MIVEYHVFCFDRTLTLNFKQQPKHSRETILGYLDILYDKWQNAQDTITDAMPLEEFLVFGISIFCDQMPEWTSTDNE